MNNNSRINSIQLLRAIAVILVVHCHVMDFQGVTGQSFQQHFFYLQDFGAAGVDIFFVISGFIITVIASQYLKGKKEHLFLMKRMVRVVPLYWLVSVLFIIYYYLDKGRLFSKASILKTIIFFPFFSKLSFTIPVIHQGWTLSFELFFYILTFIAMVAGGKKYLLIIFLILSGFTGFNYLIIKDNGIINFLGNGIMLEFLMGIIIGFFFLSDFFIRLPVTNIIFIG